MTMGGLSDKEKFRNGDSLFVFKCNSHCAYFSEELVNDFIKYNWETPKKGKF